MRKSLRFTAFFLSLVLVFSCFLGTLALDSDPRFESYINMADGTEEIGGEPDIPNLFRQDAAHGSLRRFPLVVKDGVEYVPVSLFILYPYVEINYSKISDGFYLTNSRNNRYISFNVSENKATTNDGTIEELATYIFNRTRYIPARPVAEILGFNWECYDDPVKGIYAFRVYDGNSQNTLEELLQPYIEEFAPDEEQPPEVDDSLDHLASRTVCFTYTGIGDVNTPRILETLELYKIRAGFVVTREDILSYNDRVRGIYAMGHGLSVTASAEGSTAYEYAKSLVENLDKANDALLFTLKRKTRICVLPADIPEGFVTDPILYDTLAEAGYIVFDPNTDTGDGPEMQESAYAVSARIKNKITSGFAEDKKAVVTCLLYCSDKTTHYSADVAEFVNKYEQFSFLCPDESILISTKEN